MIYVLVSLLGAQLGLASWLDASAVRRVCPLEYKHAETWEKANENDGVWKRDWLLELPYYLPALKPALHFKSDKRLQVANDVTVATQLSLSRLPSLQLQCTYWSGTLAAALYLPLHQGRIRIPDSVVAFDPGLADTKGDVKAVLMYLHNWFASFDQKLQDGTYACALHLIAFVEQLPDTISSEWAYPVNALRNKALDMVTTEVVILLDGDFVTGPVRYMDDLVKSNVSDYQQLVHSMATGHAVYVLPSFEPSRTLPLPQQMQALRVAVLHSDKGRMVELLKCMRVRKFQQNFHKVTNVEQWVVTDQAYMVEYDSPKDNMTVSKTAYEPYLMALRKDVPYYDERFRGYHYNKVSHIYQVFASGAKFLVHPTAFVMHTPHLSDTQTKSDATFYKPLEAYLMEKMSWPLRDLGDYAPMVADLSLCDKA